MQITGTVTYINLSGGFWGIKGDDGEKYNPLDTLPKKFQQEGLQVRAEVSHSNAFSVFMWGRNVDVKKIEKN